MDTVFSRVLLWEEERWPPVLLILYAAELLGAGKRENVSMSVSFPSKPRAGKWK